jgi:hypothetical protein
VPNAQRLCAGGWTIVVDDDIPVFDIDHLPHPPREKLSKMGWAADAEKGGRPFRVPPLIGTVSA